MWLGMKPVQGRSFTSLAPTGELEPAARVCSGLGLRSLLYSIPAECDTKNAVWLQNVTTVMALLGSIRLVLLSYRMIAICVAIMYIYECTEYVRVGLGP